MYSNQSVDPFLNDIKCQLRFVGNSKFVFVTVFRYNDSNEENRLFAFHSTHDRFVDPRALVSLGCSDLAKLGDRSVGTFADMATVQLGNWHLKAGQSRTEIQFNQQL